jgi:hypothetical protein
MRDPEPGKMCGLVPGMLPKVTFRTVIPMKELEYGKVIHQAGALRFSTVNGSMIDRKGDPESILYNTLLALLSIRLKVIITRSVPGDLLSNAVHHSRKISVQYFIRPF